MDYLLPKSNRMKAELFGEFHSYDLIPYSIALLMLAGIPYLLFLFIEITKHVSQ